MTDETGLDTNSEQYLRGAIARGNAILFTGAGFSAEATNLDGEHLPVGSKLARVLWPLAFPDLPFDPDSSLGEVFEVARSSAGNRTRDLLNSTLRVAPGSLPEWYRTYFLLPWYRIYTLNIDDLVPAVQRQFELPEEIDVISAFQEGVTPEHLLAAVHLNGVLDDFPKVTFAPPQYGSRTASADPWFDILCRDLISHPVIFIGTALDEPTLWHHLAMRGDRPSGAELRPKSFLVSPSLPVARRAMLSGYNIKFVELDAKGFYDQYLKTIAIEASRRPVRRGTSSSTFSDVGTLRTQTPVEPENFLLGRHPQWGDITEGFAVPRSCESDLVRLLERTSGGALFISGTAGSGKSTLLKRLAVTMQARGKKTIWLNEDAPAPVRKMISELRAAEVDLVVFDHLERFGRRGLDLVRASLESDSPPAVLAAMSSPAFAQLAIEDELGDLNVESHALRVLDDQEIRDLIQALSDANRLGVLAGMSDDDRVHAFERSAGRQLLVAMLEATTGTRFEQKIADECEALPADLRLAYGITSLATAHRYPLPRDMLLGALSDHSTEGLEVVDKLLRQRLLLRMPDECLAARHPVVAREVIDHFSRAGQLLSAIERLAFVLASRITVQQRNSRERRLLTTLTKHDYLRRTTDSTEDVRSMYQDLEQLLRSDAHFWLQRGAFEVESGSADLAENFLSQARALSNNDYMIETEWAYLRLKQACEDPSDQAARRRFDEAQEILYGVIEEHGSRSPNTFVILGRNTLQWCARADLPIDEQISLIGTARATLRDGLRLHSGNRQLERAFEEIDRAYLELAVPESERHR
ncbi:MAG: hypothetical protein GY788_27775 [bacterium]|nr:hypothetical protein [bacterium]